MTTASPPGIDLDSLTPWFSEHVAPVKSLSAQIVGHGRSNLTYRVEAEDGRAWVVRRPPLSHVQKTAHDMAREFRIISALEPTGFPVPKPYALCTDDSVIGAQFYVMEFVDGIIAVDPNEVGAKFDEGDRRKIGEELVDVLVRLHSFHPEEIGLKDFGRPSGYLERQVRRFGEQLETIRYRETKELDDLAKRLQAAIPEERRLGIVHGDYRLDNAILNDEGHMIAVLDWEMCTLGDSLADMGLLQMYWGNPTSSQLNIGATSVMSLPGFPTWEEAAARYEEKSGADLSGLDFYTVLAHFKLGVILENMYKRFLDGGTVGAGFEMIGQQAVVLGKRGLEVADESTIANLRG
ncbi:MAG: phosphotransferase family protein [Chloroflexi bacterium]|nr:phosphotransferase family protein [Chloroflexota bacterium]MCI0784334.1 phosphotransferase family protein [Chloroflexota bacterium]MCI0817345.1 phosphotransferase family protein [Chloroflexota bacterium]MCI0832089.1 phosphotransferase family protein [Chloroflexota bacterium]MCI0839136.1 phosphotransferase family protein [Chloroflexota bacterium]